MVEREMEHLRSPRNVGKIAAPDAVGTVGSVHQPPVMVVHFRLSGGVVKEVKYQVFGCGAAIAAGSMLTEMITDCSIHECLALTRQDLVDALGGFPSDKVWCVDLAIAAMREGLAISDGNAT